MQPERHDRLDDLRARNIAVPAVFHTGAWLTVELGVRSPIDLGAHATQLLLWLPVDDAGWADATAALGPRGAASSRTVSALAGSLWDGAESPEVSIAADRCTVHGVEYPAGAQAFGNVFWKHGWVLATRAGLLVSLVNQ
jgi:hypothetical protein